MPLNAWGDLMAGVVGPVALLWLVLGYLQQGDELRQNTEALVLQQQELKTTAEANTKLAEAANKSHRLQNRVLELQSRAILVSQIDFEEVTWNSESNEILAGLSSMEGHSILLKNYGAPVRDISVKSSSGMVFVTRISDNTYRLRYRSLSFGLETQPVPLPDPPPPFPFDIEVTYYNGLNLKKVIHGSWNSVSHLELGVETGESIHEGMDGEPTHDLG